MSLSSVLDGITLIADVLTTHVENHSGTAAVLNSSVATELYKVGFAQPRGEMVTSLRNLQHLLHGEVQLLTLCYGELVLQRQSARSTSNNITLE